jgi:hypothetical protein
VSGLIVVLIEAIRVISIHYKLSMVLLHDLVFCKQKLDCKTGLCELIILETIEVSTHNFKN